MSKSGVFLLLGALLAGGAIGYVAGTSGGYVDTGPMPDDGPAERGRVREVYVTDPVAGGSGGADLAGLLESIGGGEGTKTGSGQISGRVETEDGQPLAGVVLRAEAVEERQYSRDTSGAPPEEPDLVKAVEEMVKKRNKKLSTRCEARSNAAGTYVIEGLTDAKYRVQAYCRGWRISPKPGTRTFTMKAGETADFIAKPTVGIPIAFRTPDGADPKRAYVIAKGGQYPRNYPWSREHSTIYLSPGDYTLQGMAGEFGEMKSEEVEVTLKAGEPMDEIVLAVDIKPGIRGKVTFPAGSGMSWCRISAIPVIAGQEPDPERLSGSRKQASVSMARMEYVLADLEPGTWLVGISMGNAEVLEHRVVEIGNSMVTVDFEIPEPDPEDSVLVRVEAPDGRLLRTARVWGGYEMEGGSPMYGGSQAVILEDGSWRVPHYSRPGFEPTEDGAYVVTASDSKFGQKRVQYDPGSTPELTIRFDPPGTLIVTVTNYRGTVYQDATRLSLVKKSSNSGGLGGLSSSRMVPFGVGGRGGGLGKDGVQKMQNISPGDYELQVYLHGKRWNQHLVHREDVSVKSGENRATVALPPLHDVVVLVPAPAEGEKHRYSLSPLERDRTAPWSQPPAPKVDGTRVTFTSVPAGTYMVMISGGRVPQKMVVAVPGAGIVRFAAQVFSAKYVTIDDETGYLGSVGLKTGDLVIGLDGVEFKDATHMGARFMEARANPSTKLMVLRGAKRFTVAVDLKLSRGREAGGSWRDSVR